jgi:hypothetical protein
MNVAERAEQIFNAIVAHNKFNDAHDRMDDDEALDAKRDIAKLVAAERADVLAAALKEVREEQEYQGSVWTGTSGEKACERIAERLEKLRG